MDAVPYAYISLYSSTILIDRIPYNTFMPTAMVSVRIDHAYKVLINSKREARLFKMIEVADHKHIRYDDEIQLSEGIASIMERHGFDPMNEEEWDRYLNSDLGNIITIDAQD